MPLYRVEITTDVLVYAENDQDACHIASNVDALDLPEWDTWAREITSAKEFNGNEGDSLPFGDGPGDVDYTCAEILAGAHLVPLPERPGRLVDLPGWLVHHKHAAARRSHVAAADRGNGAAFAFTGHALLVVRSPDAAGEPAHAMAPKVLALSKSDDAAFRADVEVGALFRLTPNIMPEARVWEMSPLRVGAAVVDAFLVAHWIVPAIQLGGDDRIVVEWTGTLDPVRFIGAQWSAVVMPYRHDGEREVAVLAP